LVSFIFLKKSLRAYYYSGFLIFLFLYEFFNLRIRSGPLLFDLQGICRVESKRSEGAPTIEGNCRLSKTRGPAYPQAPSHIVEYYPEQKSAMRDRPDEQSMKTLKILPRWLLGALTRVFGYVSTAAFSFNIFYFV